MSIFNLSNQHIQQNSLSIIGKSIKLAAVVLLIIKITACSTGKYIPVDDVVKLDVKFADPRWNGVTIPNGEGCKRCGENGSTPALIVKNIPVNTNAIIMEYCDRSYQLMNNGGHGIIGFWLVPNTGEVFIPSVPGHTFELPENFFLIAEHLKPGLDKAGAYLPPCSCRGGNSYSVKVKAVYEAKTESGKSLLLGEYELIMGTDR
ncbi:MAG: hypothetical protein V1720_22475 [bacterium]